MDNLTPRHKKRLKKRQENDILKANKTSKVIKYYNYLLTITYDGSFFGGYAIQSFSNTIEQNLKDVVEKYLNENIKMIGSSRTDAKVHAIDQKVSFKTSKKLDFKKFLNFVNENLKNGIEVKSIELKDNNFNPRFETKDKTYIYKINTKKDIFLNNYSYFWNVKDIDVNKLNEICSLFIGTHDFINFSNPKKDTSSTIKTINYFKFKEIDENNYIFEINGDGFLYNMVRIIIGFVLNCYEKNIAIDKIKQYIDSNEKNELFQKIKPNGLYLKKINY